MEIRPKESASVTNLSANPKGGGHVKYLPQSSYHKMYPVMASFIFIASTEVECRCGEGRESVLNF